MSNKFVPISPQAGFDQSISQINRNFQELDREAVTKVFYGPNHKPAVTIGRIGDESYGISFSDGTTTFLTLTKDGIILNDGTNDRILIGKDEGGF